MKKFVFAVVTVLFLAMPIFAPREASAVPAFARQTGMACNACHFQHFPVLNAFGRAFKAGGFTMVGGQSLVEGDVLSIPATLNAALITKVRFQKRNGDSNVSDTALNKGEVQFPDEAALILGGRIGEHVGFYLESGLKQGDDNFAQFKMPVKFDTHGVNLLFIPFTTDSHGAPFGFELLNTGAVMNQRAIEHRTAISAQQYIGTGGDTTGAATGFAFVASRPDIGFVNYSAWYHKHGDAAAGPFLSYIRVAATPTLMGWDLGVGGQVWTGTSKINDGTITKEKAEAWAVDAQAQGIVGNFPLGVYLSYANANKSDSSSSANIFNSNTNHDKEAWAVMAELGVLPTKLTVAAGYRGGRNGVDTDNATTVAGVYTPMQNLQVQFDYSWFSGDAQTAAAGDQLATLMLFTAF